MTPTQITVAGEVNYMRISFGKQSVLRKRSAAACDGSCDGRVPGARGAARARPIGPPRAHRVMSDRYSHRVIINI
ncbi:unnamed protein product [Colias eurytheme]|nr:unnamed protein product [Colias eurytheme]